MYIDPSYKTDLDLLEIVSGGEGGSILSRKSCGTEGENHLIDGYSNFH